MNREGIDIEAAIKSFFVKRPLIVSDARLQGVSSTNVRNCPEFNEFANLIGIKWQFIHGGCTP
jgi:hypothetical protein